MQIPIRSGEPRLSRQDRAITRMIAVRVKRGDSLDRIARTSRVPYARIRYLARLSRIRYKHQRPTKEQVLGAVAAVRDQGATFRAAAAQFGLSRTAVHRYVTARRKKSIDAVGELVVVNGQTEYSRHKRTWRCPVHGRVTLWPCVACAAIAAKS